MKRLFKGLSIALAVSILTIFLSACTHKTDKEIIEETVDLNQETVTAFAHQIVYSVNRGDADFFNNAFDKKHIKQVISENSIVFSALDTDFGKEFFEGCFRQGDLTVQTINDGGDFHFQRYYEKEGEHHIVFRTYQGYGIKIEDYIVDTVDNEIKIKEGFTHNLATTISKQVEYTVLLNVLQKTDPEGNTKAIITADQLLKEGKNKEAYTLLQENKEFLKDYPHFTQSYLRAAFMANPHDFIRFIDQYENLDERTILVHKLLYYTNGGYLKESEEIINQLIEQTADDPIYLFLFAHANFVAQKYENALTCIENVEKVLPPLWDIWQTKLQCCEKLHKNDLFAETILTAKSAYGMSNKEILDFTRSEYPKMLKLVEKKLSEIQAQENEVEKN
ncbi:MAG: hypothetical protein MJZ76_00015 [Bacteroidales bacterium]|nr:hypothetical protein [Bacteroidales bacterium]